ncbi:C-type lectin domain family 10 member A-like [Haliotis cracherodii]|uniref:C-type lectin domain family 10 member A-like n=1 Tax=Haliotis cracherodii TaxID=6455 RepID=UPI0039E979C1
MKMALPVCMLVTLLALTQSIKTSAFRGLDFASVFKGQDFAPPVINEQNGSTEKTSSFAKRLTEIEKRLTASIKDGTTTFETETATKLDSRLDDLEKRLEESKTNDTDVQETKTKVEKMGEKLATLESNLSSVSEVASTVEQRLAASSEKNEKDMNKIISRSAATDHKVTAIEEKVGAMKSKLTDVESNFQKLGAEVKSAKLTHDDKQQGNMGTGVRARNDATGNMGTGVRARNDATDARCPSDFTYDQSTKLCLKLLRTPKTSSDANIDCLMQADDGRLVQMETREKHIAVVNFLHTQGQTSNVFVGGVRDNGKYTWLDGTEITNGNWCPRQPENRDCVSLWRARGFCLDDSWCSGRNPYVCEVPLE